MHFAPINAEFAEAIAVTRRDYSRMSRQLGTGMEGLPSCHALFVKIAGPTMGF